MSLLHQNTLLFIMTRIHSRADPSPDPLALGDDVDMLVDCIEVIVPAPILVPVNRLRRAPTRRGRVKPVVENLSPRKRTQSQTKSDAGRVRTPLMRASQSSNRAAPTPVSKGEKNAEAKPLVTPTKSAVKTPVSRPSVSRSSKPTLSSSVSELLPNPSPSIPRKRPRLSSAGEDDTFTDPSPSSISAVSREAFLANEALRRQREARKFVYKGDANAPKLTRSGKVVGEVREGTEEVDEYGEAPEEDGGMESDVAQELVMQDEPTILLPTPSIAPDTPMRVAPVVPLPASARPHVLQILSTLTSQSITTNPPAVIDEENNEALQGLLNLFKGTVERGEGNSALVVGARGAGKTHVSCSSSSRRGLTSRRQSAGH